jgi:hypothetical protein
MAREHTAPIVAELGRPETAGETAVRKATASAERRKHQTANNLVYSLIVTVALAIGAVLMAPTFLPGVQQAQNVNYDYAAIARQGAGVEPDPLIVPELPKTWHSNSAQLRQQTSDGIDEWYIGLITPSKQYIGVAQGFDANSAWLSSQVAHTSSSSSTELAGIRWNVYDNRSSSANVGDAKYALATQQGRSTVVLYGTASDAEFRQVAESVAAQLTKDGQMSVENAK